MRMVVSEHGLEGQMLTVRVTVEIVGVGRGVGVGLGKGSDE